jgi:hypothetical protein
MPGPDGSIPGWGGTEDGGCRPSFPLSTGQFSETRCYSGSRCRARGLLRLVETEISGPERSADGLFPLHLTKMLQLRHAFLMPILWDEHSVISQEDERDEMLIYVYPKVNTLACLLTQNL